MHPGFHRLLKRFGYFACAALLSFCSDPVEPSFDLNYGLIYVDGFASTEPGLSYVVVLETVQEFGVDGLRFRDDATVRFRNVGTGAEVMLTVFEERYLPPDDFTVAPGEEWQMEVVLGSGKRIVSRPERVRDPVDIDALDVRYDPEVAFESIYSRLVPGHELLVDFTDPADEENFYLWQFRSHEQLSICARCEDKTVLREGECTTPYQNILTSPLLQYYTYFCDVPCWQIRYNRDIVLYSDEFSNGRPVVSLPVAQVLLFTKEDILVELQQHSLSREAYRYFLTLKDLTENNAGFNAPLPATLIGNLSNPEDEKEFVPGRFTAAAATIRRIYIERQSIREDPLEPRIIPQQEGPEAPAPQVTTAPCVESFFRTRTIPTAWPD